MEKEGVPIEFIDSCMDAIDCNFYFFGEKVSPAMMYVVLGSTIAILIGIFVLQNALKKKVK